MSDILTLEMAAKTPPKSDQKSGRKPAHKLTHKTRIKNARNGAPNRRQNLGGNRGSNGREMIDALRQEIDKRRATLTMIAERLWARQLEPDVAYMLAHDDLLPALRRVFEQSEGHARLILTVGLGMTIRQAGALYGVSAPTAWRHYRSAMAALGWFLNHPGIPMPAANTNKPGTGEAVFQLEGITGYATLAIGVPMHGGKGEADLILEREPRDAGGGWVAHHRGLDVIDVLRRAGTIDQRQTKAARDLQRDFRAAGYDPLKAAQLLRTTDTQGQPQMQERQSDASARIRSLMRRVGGTQSSTGAALWHVVCIGRTVKEFAATVAWGVPGSRPRRVSDKSAAGIVAASLDVAAAFYDIENAKD